MSAFPLIACAPQQHTSRAIASKLSVEKNLLLLSAGGLALPLRRRCSLKYLNVQAAARTTTDRVKLPPVNLRGMLQSGCYCYCWCGMLLQPLQ